MVALLVNRNCAKTTPIICCLDEVGWLDQYLVVRLSLETIPSIIDCLFLFLQVLVIRCFPEGINAAQDSPLTPCPSFSFVLISLVANFMEDEKSQEQIIPYPFGVLPRKDGQSAAATTYVTLFHDLCWVGWNKEALE